MKTLGIVAHSAEGAALCFLTACREGGLQLGPHMHPTIVMSAVPMALSMPGWETEKYNAVAEFLTEGVRMVAHAGVDFYVCPDNTAHGWKRVGLLGTKWTMTGPVYARALHQRGFERIIPEESVREQLNAAIFDELCQSIFNAETTQLFVNAIEDLKARGAECVILGCTEIPLIVTETNSPLPVLDSTRLLAKYAVKEATSERPIEIKSGWLPI